MWHHPDYIPAKFDDHPQFKGGVGYWKKSVGETDGEGVFTFLLTRPSQNLTELQYVGLQETTIVQWWEPVKTKGHWGPGVYYLEGLPAYEESLLNADPILSTRTIQEMWKLLIEWSQAPGVEGLQNDVRQFVAHLSIPKLVFEDIVTNVPDQAVARYLRGNPEAKMRDMSVPDMSEILEDWTVRKVIGEI